MRRRAVIVTGELSGEKHAVHLVRALSAVCPFDFSAIGSTALTTSGVNVFYDYRSISLVGVVEIFRKAREIREAYRALKKEILQTRPDLVIFVDFGLFNLRLAAPLAKRLSIPAVYFIPPQVWASRKGRIDQIRSYIDLVLTILPFEEALYRKHGVRVAYVGHPYARSVKATYSKKEFLSFIKVPTDAPLITVMPGSRTNEIRRHMPAVLEIASRLDGILGQYNLLLPVADSLSQEVFGPFLSRRKNIFPVRGLAYDCLTHSDAALIKSGSTTLEAAILGVPSVVFYKVSYLEYLLARMIVQTPYISLPNIIAGKEVFPEFVQNLDPDRIAKTLVSMLKDDATDVRRELKQVQSMLAGDGSDPYATAGREILSFLEQTYGPLFQTP